MADITPIVSLNGKIAPTASLNGELAMPEKVWMQGPPGPQGPKGDTGETGPAGAGVPDGGTVGQLLGKTETGTAWIDPPQSGVQPDWNQNDETQPDYVKNRPFYTGDPVETVLLEEITVAFVDNGSGFYVAQFKSAFEATAGETYKVYWDGAAYECTCVDDNNYLVIGNISFMGSGADTGEPFCVTVLNGAAIIIATTDTSASHTISISGLASEIVKVDEKYLPEITADKLPAIPADKLPAIPVIEFTTSIFSDIANATQPSFAVSNLSYSEIYSVVEKGNFQIKDSDGYNYIPIKCNIDTSGKISITIMVVGSPMTCAILVCSANKTRFYRDGWWQIEATKK